ncbi:MAG: hypothetical protein LBG81_09040 [Coriobacteriaceae bacterium]|jgi:hypothetical protein|nr:hypothetical protein [Coriobacteriaceae bacterium]
MPKRFAYLLLYDLHKGLAEVKWRFMVAFALFAVLFVRFLIQSHSIEGEWQATVVDAFAFVSLGMGFFDVEKGVPFMLDLPWAMLLVAQLGMVGFYPADDFDENGERTALLAKSRLLWWLSKCTWVFLTLLLFFGVCLLLVIVYYLVAGVFGFGVGFFGAGAFDFHAEVVFLGHETMQLQDAPETLFPALAAALCLPFVVSLGLGLAQVLLSFVVGRAVGLVLLLSYAIVSTYFTNPFLVGAYGMLLRNSLFNPDGISNTQVFLSYAVLIVFVVFAGVICFRKRDLMGAKREG